MRCDLVQPVVQTSQQAVNHTTPPTQVGTTTNEQALLERIRILEKHIKDRESVSVSTPESLRDSSRAPSSKTAATPSDDLDSDAVWLETIYSGQDLGVRIVNLDAR